KHRLVGDKLFGPLKLRYRPSSDVDAVASVGNCQVLSKIGEIKGSKRKIGGNRDGMAAASTAACNDDAYIGRLQAGRIWVGISNVIKSRYIEGKLWNSHPP